MPLPGAPPSHLLLTHTLTLLPPPSLFDLHNRAISKHMDSSCIKVVEGNRDMTTALLQETFEVTFFTGSAFVGRLVAEAAAKHLRPCVLELGGKSPTIVDKSANLEHAVQRLIWGTFLNGGQTCVRPDFVMVHHEVAEEFFKLCKKFIKVCVCEGEGGAWGGYVLCVCVASCR